jgi:hypothetical protein
VFRDLVLARIIEPVSKLDSARVPEEADIAPASYPTACRRLRMYARGLLAGQAGRGVRGAGPIGPCWFIRSGGEGEVEAGEVA